MQHETISVQSMYARVTRRARSDRVFISTKEEKSQHRLVSFYSLHTNDHAGFVSTIALYPCYRGTLRYLIKKCLSHRVSRVIYLSLSRSVLVRCRSWTVTSV